MPQSGFEDGFTIATSASLDIWVKELHAKVPGAIEEYIYEQLKLTVKDFFKRTTAWRNFFGPFTALADDGLIPMNPVDANSNVIQILDVTRNGISLSPVTPVVVPRTLVNETSSRSPRSYYVEPYDIIHLVPIPVVDITQLYVTAALTPRLRDDNHIEQWILDMHYESILAGVLQRLYNEPGKVYSNIAQSEYWGKRYRSEMTRARSIASQNYKAGAHPWAFPSWTR